MQRNRKLNDTERTREMSADAVNRIPQKRAQFDAKPLKFFDGEFAQIFGIFDFR
jgi:hypothetical protein